MNFRNIEKADNKQLSEMIKEVFREFKIDKPGTVFSDPTTDTLFEFFQKQGAEYWIAEEEGDIVGGCGVYPTDGLPDGYAELVRLFLKKEFRGKGIGRILLEKSIESAKRLGYRRLYLESFPELGKAVGMYEKAGFTTIDHSFGNSGHFACTIWMIKDL